jgi:Uma2 family endonuclease
MSTVTSKDLMTAETFFEWVNLPENRDLHVELERGEIVEMPPPGKYHGFVCGNIARLLGNYAAERGAGYVCSNDAGLVVDRDPDTVRGPDVTFYDDTQTADDMDRRFATEPPLLAVEVQSPNDRVNRTVLRVTQMLQLGVRLIWVVDPETRDVSVYRPGVDPYVAEESQDLTGEEVLPDFRCRVADFFGVPGKEAVKTADRP